MHVEFCDFLLLLFTAFFFFLERGICVHLLQRTNKKLRFDNSVLAMGLLTGGGSTGLLKGK